MASRTVDGAAAILHMLKEQGDINETHKGGNAARTLFERIEARGFQYNSYKQFYSYIERLRKSEKIYQVKKGGSTYAIRLIDAKDMPPNPFVGTDLVPYTPENAPGLLGEIREWPITKRAQLMRELSDSIATDLSAYKGVVTEGL